MALIVEDGDGVVYANSYVTVAYVDSYHSLRFNTTWSGSTLEKEAALVKSADYIEGKYGPRFRGEVATTSGLSFPRVAGTAFYDDGTTIVGLPDVVKRAAAEYALLSITDSLYPSAVDGGVSSYSKSVGSISESVSYSATGVNTYSVHPKGDSYIVGLLKIKRSDRA